MSTYTHSLILTHTRSHHRRESARTDKVGGECAGDAVELALPPARRVARVEDVDDVTHREHQVALLLPGAIVDRARLLARRRRRRLLSRGRRLLRCGRLLRRRLLRGLLIGLLRRRLLRGRCLLCRCRLLGRGRRLLIVLLSGCRLLIGLLLRRRLLLVVRGRRRRRGGANKQTLKFYVLSTWHFSFATPSE